MLSPLRFSLALLFVFSAASLAPAQEPGPESWASFRNGNAQLGVATTKLPDKLELLWKAKTIDGVVSTPAIANGKVYVPTLTGFLRCFDLKSGQELWKYRSIKDQDPDTFAPGFKAAPLVTADTIYIGDEDGILHAINRKDGTQRWIFSTDGEIAGCPSPVKDKLIFGSHDSFLYCLNTKGELVWKFQTADRVNCSPAIVGKYTFVAGCDEHLRVIDIETGKEVTDVHLASYLIASPAVKEEMLYVGTYSSEVLGVNWKKGEITWRYKDPQRDFPYHASAAVTDEFVIVGGQDKQLHCINRTTGKKVWVFRTNAQINSSAVVVGDSVYFGCNDRNLYAVNIKDGTEAWKFNAGGAISGSPAVGEGHLVFGTEQAGGYIYCFGKK